MKINSPVDRSHVAAHPDPALPVRLSPRPAAASVVVPGGHVRRPDSARGPARPSGCAWSVREADDRDRAGTRIAGQSERRGQAS